MKVPQPTDSHRGRDDVNVAKLGEGGVLSNGINCRHERVALLASVGLPNLVCGALSVLPDACAVGSIELDVKLQQPR